MRATDGNATIAMTLIGAILKKVQSTESFRAKKLASPPPELEDVIVVTKKMKKKRVDKFKHVRPRVSTSPPRYISAPAHRKLARGVDARAQLLRENFRLLARISRQHYTRGKVDSHWAQLPPPCRQYHENRVARRARILAENQNLHQILTNAVSRVACTALLQEDWARNRRRMIQLAQRPFVLFPPVPREIIEDDAFRAPAGVVRPRVQLTLGLEGGCRLGGLRVELFTDVCPATCRLFLQLLKGYNGFGYVGTRFFRKVPHLYWTGGDVVHDNGFGCCMQSSREVPIGAENFHFPHSMPGLLSMRVTADDEMCGIFNITFKPMPQFDLRNVVFGRIIRPSSLYNAMTLLSSPRSPRPVVRLAAATLPEQRAARQLAARRRV